MNKTTHTPPHAILLIEDEPAIREMIKIILEDLPAEITSVATADEGIVALQRQPWNLIIADVQTPGRYDGFHLAHVARQHLPQTGIILMSGYYGEFDAPRSPGLSFIEKPWKVDDFYALVTFHLAEDRFAPD